MNDPLSRHVVDGHLPMAGPAARRQDVADLGRACLVAAKALEAAAAHGGGVVQLMGLEADARRYRALADGCAVLVQRDMERVAAERAAARKAERRRSG